MNLSTILHIFILYTLLYILPYTSSKLVSVQIISRHGTRAPNPVVEQLCPNDKTNLQNYDTMYISLAGVTGNGMKELYILGNYTRQRYIIEENKKFISQHYNSAQVYIQAVSEDRTIQSAYAWANALYPEYISTPKGYVHDIPPPIPVYTLTNNHDDLLETRKALCKKRLKYDSDLYDKNIGSNVLAKHSDLIQQLEEICGISSLDEAVIGSGDNVGDAIKDITDAMVFDYMSNFTPMNNLTFDLLKQFRTLAVKQLFGRIIGNKQQITYMNGALPQQLIDNFNNAMQGGIKLLAYHAHRELLYSIGAFLDIEYNVDFPGMPLGAIPPATTLFIELHEIHNTLYVEFYLWIPCYPVRHGRLDPIEHNCRAKQVYMKSCDKECTYEQFRTIIQNKISDTGNYIQLCAPYNNVDHDNDNSNNVVNNTIISAEKHSSQSHHHSQHGKDNRHGKHNNDNDSDSDDNNDDSKSTTKHRHAHHKPERQQHHATIWPWLVGFGVAIIVITIGSYVYQYYQRRRQYTSLLDDEYPSAE